ncbi:MAG: drug/metabolite transporter (DMT)-like permease [Flavobacteriales bacterium]|jgi:drug/metabolite transporter (DMT)-like permease
MSLWIAFTLLAAFMQAIRTAGQKSLSKDFSAMATTFARYLYALPFVISYLLVLLFLDDNVENHLIVPEILSNSRFLIFALVASVAQILATFALIKVFEQRNFAIGTSFAKTEAVQVALFGSLLFHDTLNIWAWVAVILGVVGTLTISGIHTDFKAARNASVFGIASGLLFAFTSLFLRQASLSLPYSSLINAASTLAFMVIVQTIICASYLKLREPEQLAKLKHYAKHLWFIGASSAMGSIGWFTAMSLENPAVVKTLGQVEFFITLALTHYYFKEKIARFEWFGMVCILSSVVLVFVG